LTSSHLLSQITALSTSLHLTPKQLAEAWEAHSLTKNLDELNDVTFNAYRNSLSSNKNVAVVKNGALGKRSSPSGAVTPTPGAKRVTVKTEANTTTTIARNGDKGRNGLSAVDNLTTPGGRSTNSAKSPSVKSEGSTPITPPKTPKYVNRITAGKFVTSYNPHNLPTAVEMLAKKSAEEKVVIGQHVGCTVSVHPGAAHPTSTFRHMFTPLEKRSAALEERLLGMNDVLCEGYGVKTEEEEMLAAVDGVEGDKKEVEEKTIKGTWTPVGMPKQNTVLCVGRICNEAHEGRLNRASIRLEGSRQHSSGSRIHLDLQSYLANNQAEQSYSFFPGQIVGIEGINSSGRTMQASQLIEGLPPPSDAIPANEMFEYHHSAECQNGMPLSIVALAGPFTTSDNLDYDPLIDALVKVAENKPDVVILTGPFVDRRQPLVNSGLPVVQDEQGNCRVSSCEQLFAAQISVSLEELFMNDPKLKTQFVLVPSVEDAFLDGVYPQPPLVNRSAKIDKKLDEKFDNMGSLGLDYVESSGWDATSAEDKEHRKMRKRVHCVSNPTTLKVNEVTIGVTSSDVLFHISSDECNANLPPGTRLSRIAQHLIQQRSYYPLFPPAKGACLDLSRDKEWEMPVQPDILIVPSKLASFARKVLNTTVVVNPGELTKNRTGGTYATIDIHPMKKEALEAGMNEEMMSGVQDRVRVDIKRI